MKVDVQLEMSFQAFALFSRAPSSPCQPVDAVPKHGTSVVERKKWVKSDLFQLPLSHDTTPSSLESFMLSLWKVELEPARVLGVLIGCDLHFFGEDRLNLSQKGARRLRTLVFSFTVLLTGNSGQWTVRRHLTDSKAEDLSAPRKHHERDAQGQALGAFEGLHFIELERVQGLLSRLELLNVVQSFSLGLGGKEEKFPGDRLEINPQHQSNPSLRHVGSEQGFDGGIDRSLLLSKARRARGV